MNCDLGGGPLGELRPFFLSPVANEMPRTIIIGDIHGCFDELAALLNLVAPASDDRIIALGDIVDRGPDSEKVLAFFRDTPNATSLLGNHERKHIRSARGQVRAALSQMIVRQQLAERYADWLAFMDTLPQQIELPEAILVHGFFEPGVSLEQQRDVVVVGTLTGEQYIREKLPDPWYDHYAGPKPLVVGHHSYLGTGEPVIRDGLFYGIDTGCVHGGRLTSLVLPEFRIVSVPARADYWSGMRQSCLAMMTRKRSPLDIPLEVLLAYVSGGDEDDPARPVSPVVPRIGLLAEACRQLAHTICEEATARTRAILAELARSPDWASLEDGRRAARFAGQVQGHPASSLLFKALRGRLDVDGVLEMARTPRGLQRLAENLGLAATVAEALVRWNRTDKP